jgi:ParB/RepB/Spo0J family partition protein
MISKLIPIKSITTKVRFRKEFDDTTIAQLAADIKANGLLHPITINGKNILICGERRLRAYVVNEETEIPAFIRTDLSPLDEKVLELGENLNRENFNWWEECLAIRELHKAFQSKHGEAKRGHSEGWKMEDTANEIKRSTSTVSRAIEMAYILDQYPIIITECKSYSAAMKYYKEQEGARLMAEKARRQALEGMEDFTVETEKIEQAPGEITEKKTYPTCIHADSILWLPENIKKPLAHLFFIDPPYGIDAHKKSMVASDKHYDDSSGLIWKATMIKLLKACYNVATDGAHAYLFFGMVLKLDNKPPQSLHSQWLYILENSPWDYDPLPLIWPKGASGGGGRQFEHDYFVNYEPIFFLKKGKRPFNEGRRRNSNILPSIPVYHGTQKVHPAHKPAKLYEHLILNSGLKGGVMIDPCAGSGESGKACMEHGIHSILIEELEEVYNSMVVNVHS